MEGGEGDDNWVEGYEDTMMMTMTNAQVQK